MLRKPSAVITAVGIAGAVLAGCGGNQPAWTAASHGLRTPLISGLDFGGAAQQSGDLAAAFGQHPPGRAHSTDRLTTAKVAKARPTKGPDDEESTTGAKPLNPCKLVSLAEARAITRGATRRLTDAPLGPTCIYSGTGHAAITLAVETASLSQATRYMHARKPVVVRGRRSLCGRLGVQMLYVPLSRYRLLNVTAPCGVAQRFAAVAVNRLPA